MAQTPAAPPQAPANKMDPKIETALAIVKSRTAVNEYRKAYLVFDEFKYKNTQGEKYDVAAAKKAETTFNTKEISFHQDTVNRVASAQELAVLAAQANDDDLKKLVLTLFDVVKDKEDHPAKRPTLKNGYNPFVFSKNDEAPVRTAVLRALKSIWPIAATRTSADGKPLIAVTAWWGAISNICEYEPLSARGVLDFEKKSEADDENVLGEAVELAGLLASNLAKKDQTALVDILQRRDSESKKATHIPTANDTFVVDITLRHQLNNIIASIAAKPGEPVPRVAAENITDELDRIRLVLFNSSGERPRTYVLKYLKAMGASASPIIEEIIAILRPPYEGNNKVAKVTTNGKPYVLEALGASGNFELRRELYVTLVSIGYVEIVDRDTVDRLEEDLVTLLFYEQIDRVRVAAAKNLAKFVGDHKENVATLFERFEKAVKDMDLNKLKTFKQEAPEVAALQGNIFASAALSLAAAKQHDVMRQLSELSKTLAVQSEKTPQVVCQSTLQALAVVGLNGSVEVNNQVLEAVQFVQSKTADFTVRTTATDVLEILKGKKS